MYLPLSLLIKYVFHTNMTLIYIAARAGLTTAKQNLPSKLSIKSKASSLVIFFIASPYSKLPIKVSPVYKQLFLKFNNIY